MNSLWSADLQKQKIIRLCFKPLHATHLCYTCKVQQLQGPLGPRCRHIHSLSHRNALTHIHTHSHTLMRSHSYVFPPTHTLSHTQTHVHSLAHSHMLTHTHIPHTPMYCSITHTLMRIHPNPSQTHSLTYAASQTHTHLHTYSHTCPEE